MSATTMAPALTPTAPASAPQRSAPPARKPKRPSENGAEPTNGHVVALPQHMRALARANEVRLARAQLKREVAAGNRGIVSVIRECPWEAHSMSVSELLCSQRRWGKSRSRKLIGSLHINENKQLGTFTQRQRELLATALEQRGVST
jgi:hypothetical protein